MPLSQSLSRRPTTDNEDSGFEIAPRVARFVRHTFPHHTSISQGQYDKKREKKEIVLQSRPKHTLTDIVYVN